MRELLEKGLLFAGLALVVLSIASFWIPKALQWREKLADLTPLLRDMFWTYSIYIWASHVFFAVLALGYRDWLLGQSGAAALISGFIALWWLARLAMQFFGFNLSEIEDSWQNRMAKHLLTALFIFLTVIFAGTLWWNLGGEA